jgi:hypothetical protein
MKFIIKGKLLRFNNQEWHTWFAWYPVEHHEYKYTFIIWLQFVERRWIPQSAEHSKLDGFWEYRLPVSRDLVFRGV